MKDRVENDKFDEIVFILEQYPLCAGIVAFSLKHKAAMDTVRGIAEWWLQADLTATQEALHLLVACGVIVVRTYAGVNLYSFTTNPRLQAKLEEYFRHRDKD